MFLSIIFIICISSRFLVFYYFSNYSVKKKKRKTIFVIGEQESITNARQIKLSPALSHVASVGHGAKACRKR